MNMKATDFLAAQWNNVINVPRLAHHQGHRASLFVHLLDFIEICPNWRTLILTGGMLSFLGQNFSGVSLPPPAGTRCLKPRPRFAVPPRRLAASLFIRRMRPMINAVILTYLFPIFHAPLPRIFACLF